MEHLHRFTFATNYQQRLSPHPIVLHKNQEASRHLALDLTRAAGASFINDVILDEASVLQYHCPLRAFSS